MLALVPLGLWTLTLHTTRGPPEDSGHHHRDDSFILGILNPEEIRRMAPPLRGILRTLQDMYIYIEYIVVEEKDPRVKSPY